MNALMARWLKHLPISAYLVGAGISVLAGALALNNRHQREVGALRAELSQLEHDRRVARMEADSLAKVYRVDTVRFTRYRRQVDTLRQTVETWKHDTLRVVEFVTRADSAIQSCTQALQTCEQRVGAERKQVTLAEAEIAKLKAMRPSRLTPWRDRAIGFGVGLLSGVLVRP